jgi:hypothetical protein
MAWPAAKGVAFARGVRHLSFEVTPAKQARLLTAIYRRFARDRVLRVRKAFWFTWASPYEPKSCSGDSVSFQYAGLVKTPCGSTSLARTPLLSAYARASRRYGTR